MGRLRARLAATGLVLAMVAALTGCTGDADVVESVYAKAAADSTVEQQDWLIIFKMEDGSEVVAVSGLSKAQADRCSRAISRVLGERDEVTLGQISEDICYQ